jgi:TolA-binding protein
MRNNKQKKTFRIYVVILFISAAIILLWTGYSQSKINENYKNRLNDKENENSIFEYNLNSALEENKKLNEEIGKLEKDLLDANNNAENFKKEIKNLEEAQQNVIKQYEMVLKAEYELNNGNIKESALILQDIEKSPPREKYVLEKYNKLRDKVYKEAAELFYFDGYNSFKKKDYKNAIESFNLSLKLTLDDYFSDDCYFFNAYCGYYMKDYKFSKEMIDILLNKYPDSAYYDEAKHLLKTIENVS